MRLFAVLVQAPDASIIRSWLDDGELLGIKFVKYTLARHGMAIEVKEVPKEALQSTANIRDGEMEEE